MAVPNFNYKFLVMNIGAYGSDSDGGIFNHTNLSKCLRKGTLNIPCPTPLPNYMPGIQFPYFFLADEAFPLRIDLMHPYGRKHNEEEILKDNEQVFN